MGENRTPLSIIDTISNNEWHIPYPYTTGVLEPSFFQAWDPTKFQHDPILETGCYYLTRAMENEEMIKMMRQYLINVHLIDNGADDSEVIFGILGGAVLPLYASLPPILSVYNVT